MKVACLIYNGTDQDAATKVVSPGTLFLAAGGSSWSLGDLPWIGFISVCFDGELQLILKLSSVP